MIYEYIWYHMYFWYGWDCERSLSLSLFLSLGGQKDAWNPELLVVDIQQNCASNQCLIPEEIVKNSHAEVLEILWSWKAGFHKWGSPKNPFCGFIYHGKYRIKIWVMTIGVALFPETCRWMDKSPADESPLCFDRPSRALLPRLALVPAGARCLSRWMSRWMSLKNGDCWSYGMGQQGDKNPFATEIFGVRLRPLSQKSIFSSGVALPRWIRSLLVELHSGSMLIPITARFWPSNLRQRFSRG